VEGTGREKREERERKSGWKKKGKENRKGEV